MFRYGFRGAVRRGAGAFRWRGTLSQGGFQTMVQPDFAKGGGLIPAIAQDFRTGKVLMLAYINEEAWRETLAGGRAVYFSRSPGKLWR